MLTTIAKSMSVLVSVAVACGLLTHGTLVDNAVAASATSSFADNYGSDHVRLTPSEHHIHVDNSAYSRGTYNFGSQQPVNSPKNQDDKKYISYRRLVNNDLGDGYRWPSI